MFYSQFKQDEFLEKNIFRGFRNGFYVDVGAHDGLSLNNTLYFHKNRNWSGINIEPNLNVFKKLVENRPNDINLNCAITTFNGSADFLLNDGYTEMLSGLKNNFDNRHLSRIEYENKLYNSNSKIVKVNTKTLESVFDDYNIKHIHYLSIDVEGAEFEVIKSINFEKVFIDVIEFESNYKEVSIPIINYLINKNYSIINNESIDIFMINRDSIFFRNNNF